jgi:hypothetical protein
LYLTEMQGALGQKLDAILSSHLIPHEESGPLWNDHFEDFLDLRQTEFARVLALVTGPNQ